MLEKIVWARWHKGRLLNESVGFEEPREQSVGPLSILSYKRRGHSSQCWQSSKCFYTYICIFAGNSYSHHLENFGEIGYMDQCAKFPLIYSLYFLWNDFSPKCWCSCSQPKLWTQISPTHRKRWLLLSSRSILLLKLIIKFGKMCFWKCPWNVFWELSSLPLWWSIYIV